MDISVAHLMGDKEVLKGTRYSVSSGADREMSGNGQIPLNTTAKNGSECCSGCNPLQVDGIHHATASLSGQDVNLLLSDEEVVEEANGDDPLWHQDASDNEHAVPGSLLSLSKCRPPAPITTGHNKNKEKKTMGRPCLYKGDPDSPNLRDEDRRKLKRRLANRESARRVRQKRNQHKLDLEAQMDKVQQEHKELQARAKEAEKGRLRLMSQLSQMQELWSSATLETARLLSEVTALRNSATMDASMKVQTLSDEPDEIFTPRSSSFRSNSTGFVPSPMADFDLRAQLRMQLPSSAPVPDPTASPDFVTQAGTDDHLTEGGIDWLPEADDWETLFGKTTGDIGPCV